MSQFLGLRTVIYGVSNIEEAKAWYTTLLEVEPYFEAECYVGFNIGGFELGLDPDARNVTSRADGVVAYWGVENIAAQVERINGLGARQHGEIVDVGEGILMASFLDPFGNVFGLIENPHFKLTPTPAMGSSSD